MREYLALHRSVFPSYLTIESGRIVNISKGSAISFREYHTCKSNVTFHQQNGDH